MTSSPEPFAELQPLLDRLCEGTLDEPAVARLQTLVIADEAARHFYRTYLQLHGALRLQTFPAFPPLLSSILNGAASRESPRPAPSPALGFLGKVLRSSMNSPLITTFLVAIAIYGVFGFLAWNLRPEKMPSVATGSPDPVAIVRDTTDVQWSKKASSQSAESSILSGEPLKIESGTIELELYAGTKLIIEGPADWSVDGNNSVSLRAGRLLARVPKQAIGFTVETPTAQIVDLGTEFGVEVMTDGSTHLSVINGHVRATSEVNNSAVVSAGRGINFEVGSAPREIAAEPTRFRGMQNQLSLEKKNARTVLFSDNFDVRKPSNDINPGINDRPGRQAGKLAPLKYIEPPGSRSEMTRVGDPWSRSSLVLQQFAPASRGRTSPAADFRAEGVESARYSVEFLMIAAHLQSGFRASGDWAGGIVGANDHQATVGELPSGIHFLVRNTGGYQVFDATDGHASLVMSGDIKQELGLDVSDWCLVRIDYSVPAFDGKSVCQAKLYFDNRLLGKFTTKAGLTHNFVVLDVYGGNDELHAIDNLRIFCETVSPSVEQSQ